MRKTLRLTAGVALAAAFTFGADGAVQAAPAPNAGCIAQAVAQDRTLYFPLGGQVSAIAQDPGNYVAGVESLGEILAPLASGEFPCPV